MNHWLDQEFLVVLDQRQRRNEEIPIFSSPDSQLVTFGKVPAVRGGGGGVDLVSHHPHNIEQHWEFHELSALSSAKICQYQQNV